MSSLSNSLVKLHCRNYQIYADVIAWYMINALHNKNDY